MSSTLELTINGQKRSFDCEPTLRLIDLLRDHCGLTGTKEGCGIGECGACTVLLDGEPMNACLVPVGQAAGRSVLTVEGLSPAGELCDLQREFIDRGAVQCGFCTPGMLLSATALLLHNSQPTEAEIREALAGNLCRCTGYTQIVDAIQAAAMARTGER